MNTSIIALMDEFLESLDDDPNWWDGVYCSDKAMADRYMRQFKDWLNEKGLGEP